LTVLEVNCPLSNHLEDFRTSPGFDSSPFVQNMAAKVYVDWLFTSAGKLGVPLAFDVTGKEIKDVVNEVVGQNKVVIFSKSISPHCHRAKKVNVS